MNPKYGIIRFIASVVANAEVANDDRCPPFVEGWGDCEILLERGGIRLAQKEWRGQAITMRESGPAFVHQYHAGFSAALAVEMARDSVN